MDTMVEMYDRFLSELLETDNILVLKAIRREKELI